MSDHAKYRALVVDDEPMVRHQTMQALSARGFICDPASDGAEAIELLRNGLYNVVVTDLRMPHCHGHSLAVNLLARPSRPPIVVLTGLVEPRLTNDLLARGVEHVAYKPVDFRSFADQVKLIVERGQAHQARTILGGLAGESHEILDPERAVARVRPSDMLLRLETLSRLLPLSDAALEAHQLSRSIDYGADDLAAVIQRDPSLSAEVLRLANSAYYNPTDQPIEGLEQAIARIGQRRLGELALAMQALHTLRNQQLPWMNCNSAWKKCIATGVAVELIAQQSELNDCDGLLLSGIMHLLGRIALATAYPEHYKSMVKTCADKNAAMLDVELQYFPEDHARTLARLLERWKLPKQIWQPLEHALDSYEAVRALPEGDRKKVLALKLAILIGYIATNCWEPWDLIEIPPYWVLEELSITDLPALLEATSRNTRPIVSLGVGIENHAPIEDTDHIDACLSGTVEYVALSKLSFDFLEPLITSLGIALAPTPALNASTGPCIINGLDAPRKAIEEMECRQLPTLAITDDPDATSSLGVDRLLRMPCSYKRLRTAILRQFAGL